MLAVEFTSCTAIDANLKQSHANWPALPHGDEMWRRHLGLDNSGSKILDLTPPNPT